MPMLAHRGLVEKQRRRDLAWLSAVIEQQQHVHAPGHGTVDLPPHHLQEMGAILRREHQASHAGKESRQAPR
jgi:hypothetical protein